MRSFFNKPSWATAGGDAGNAFYRRSEQTYSDIIAANREAREARQKEKDSSEDQEPQAFASPVRSKRPRLSDEAERVNLDAGTDAHTDDLASPDEQNEIIVSHRTSPGGRELPAIPKRDDLYLKNVTPDSPLPTDQDHPAGDSQPKQKDGRLSHTTQGADLLGSKVDTTDPDISKYTSGIPALSSASSPDIQSLTTALTPTSDPIIMILITSDIPGTKPLIFQRKLSQGLREVRLEWCNRQGFTDETTAGIHLTWRGRRLFDVTTCKSLGVHKEKGWLSRLMDDDTFDQKKEMRIHMEAVTNDPSLHDRQPICQTEAKQQPSLSPNPGIESPQDSDNGPMKLVLRSPGLSDLRIKARPKTLVSKLISAFREKHSIGADHDVSLLFDGDRLEPDTCLAENDIADLDLVDVQVKPQV